MADIKGLLEKRKAIKAKKPKFVRQDSHKIKRVGRKWRRPKGIDSKIRLRLKAYHKHVEMGYGSPKEVKGMDKSGLMAVIVANAKELEGVDKGKEGAVISSSVGRKKRVGILNKAKELAIKILNIREPEKYIEKVQQELKLRKEKKGKREKKKTERKEKEKKKTKDEDKLAEKIMTEEEKQEQEKKEKDKILTKKEM